MRNLIHVLHLEDDPRDAELIQHKLESGGLACDIVLANGKEGFESALTRDTFDVILCDHNLPGYDGKSAMKLARQKHPLVPVIFLSGNLGEDEAVECLKLGATDYVLKHRLERLVPAVERALQEADERRARLKAEELLRASEERFQQIAEHLGEWVWEVDADGLYTYSSPVVEKILGYRPEELVGKLHYYDLCLPTEKEALKQAGQEYFNSKLPFVRFRNHCVHRDGRIVVLETSGTPLLDRQGQLLGYRGVDMDVTERERTEELLRERAALLEAQTNASPDGVLVISENQKRLLMNQRIIEIFDAPKDILYGDDDAMLLKHVVTLTKYPDLFLEKVHYLYNHRNEISRDEIEFKNGMVLERYSAPVLGEHGKYYGRIWRFHDITKRKLADKELRESEIRLRAITDSAYDAILMMDPEGRISYWNPAAERIFGYTRTEVIGQMMHSLIAPSRYHAAHNAAFPEFLRTGHGDAVGKTLDLEGRRKDGKGISVQLSLSAIELNGAWHAVGIIRDVTEQKLAEKALKTAKEAAEVAARAKSEFLANMSHEVRTPMNGILGMVGLLLETNLSEDQRLYANAAHASGKALLAMLNDILNFSQMEAGKLEIHTQDFSLRALLDDFMGMMSQQAHQKGLVLGCVVTPEVPVDLQGDPGHLRQILTNLTANAIKFTPAGSVAIRVSVVSEAPGEVRLRFAVRDTGIGIPTDKLGRLFERFSQVDGSSTRAYGGMGLGLAISKQLTELMDGEIGVESQEGQGSEFWFTALLAKRSIGIPACAPLSGECQRDDNFSSDLPKVASERELSTSKPVSTPGSTLDRGLTPARILVVEDNFTNQQVAVGILKKLGFRAEVAVNGAEAVKALETSPYDLVLMDVQMPVMDGLEATRAIRDSQSRVLNHQIAIVAMTAHALRGDREKCLQAGMDDYLKKPIERSDLVAILEKWLKLKGEVKSNDAQRV